MIIPDKLKEIESQLELAISIWVNALKKCNYSGDMARNEHFEVQLLLDQKLAIKHELHYNPEKLKDLDWNEWVFGDKYMWCLEVGSGLLSYPVTEYCPSLKKRVENGEVVLPKGFLKKVK